MGEIVITVGLPGCGKSTHVQSLVDAGYTRVNRDTTGGRLDAVDTPFYQEVFRQFELGARKFVLDNTYMIRQQRGVVVQVAQQLGLPIRVLLFPFDIQRAQLLASRRQIQKYGRLLRPGESQTDPHGFPPEVQYGFLRDGRLPSLEEGFASIEEVTAPVVWGPEYTRKGAVVSLRGMFKSMLNTDAMPRKPGHVARPPQKVVEALKRFQGEGYIVAGVLNHPALGLSPDHPDVFSVEKLEKCLDRFQSLLGLSTPMDIVYSGDSDDWMPESFARMPLPGLGVLLIERHKLDPAQTLMIGSDYKFASCCGFQTVKEDLL